MKPSFSEEKKLWKKGYKYVVGLDEAGMGSLAGPVTAAAVTGPAKLKMKSEKLKIILREVKDSKKISPRKREELYKILTRHPSIYWGVGIVSERIIDKINIYNASRLAMKKALAQLEKKYILKSRYFSKHVADFIILDGRGSLDVPIPQKAIVKADAKVFSCAAASIIAKVTRDRIMLRLHKKYPQYRFDRHKGYPTKLHKEMLRKYGPSKIHRRSFYLGTLAFHSGKENYI